MTMKEFESYAKDKFMEIVENFKNVEPDFDCFEITIYPSINSLRIYYRDEKAVHETSFDVVGAGPTDAKTEE